VKTRPACGIDTNNVEFAAMMAPRPMFMAAATGDWTRNMLREEYPAVRAIYDLYGKGGDVEALLLDAPHNYNQANREAMYAFFGKHVLGEKDPAKFKEQPIRVEMLQDMLALHNRTLPANALTFQQLFDEWVRLAKEQTGTAPAPGLRPGRRLAVRSAQPGGWRPHPAGPPRKGRSHPRYLGERVQPAGAGGPSRWRRSRAPGGRSGATGGGRPLRADDRRLPDRQRGGAARSFGENFLTFNKTDDANRVQDILTALAWLNTKLADAKLADDERRSSAPRLIGLGKAAVWCLFAAAVSRQPVDLQADLGGFTGTDQDLVDSFFVPGIQRAGGLRAARQLAGAR